MRARRAGGLCAAVVAAAIVLSAGPSLAQSRRVETDPRTGRVVQPTDQSAAPPGGEQQSTSSEGLAERAGKSRAGGVGVRLEGRFRSNTWATRGPDGQLVEDCVPGTRP